ncbi:hypothetical protein SynBIOSE41_01867 [Synechococcus sp. BIOS-E4-1]|nr:hypothetical protein SynBIOSE41_01867 [Synechococcus sp. BIOS-E4-1]
MKPFKLIHQKLLPLQGFYFFNHPKKPTNQPPIPGTIERS